MHGWLLGITAWLIARLGEESALGRTLSRRLDAELRAAARAVRAIVFLRACALIDWNAPRPRRKAPGFAPPGARRVRVRGSALQRLTPGFARGLHRGSFAARAARLSKLVDNVARCAARLARRIQRGVPTSRLAPGGRRPILLTTTSHVARAPLNDSS